MTARLVEPEWLDELPVEDPGAIGSRRDLRRLNWFMNHAAIMSAALRAFPKPSRVVDLGAGDGAFTLKLAISAQWKNVEVVLVDRSATISPDVRRAFQALDCSVSCIQQDVFDALEIVGSADGILANLFLHHFKDIALQRLFSIAALRCRWLVACEPRRSAMALTASRLVGLIGCNAVTRHDAVASVRAGFRADEISEQWPANGDWSLKERPAGLFSHLFVASRS